MRAQVARLMKSLAARKQLDAALELEACGQVLAEQRGFDAVIAKPCLPEELVRIIESALPVADVRTHQ